MRVVVAMGCEVSLGIYTSTIRIVNSLLLCLQLFSTSPVVSSGMCFGECVTGGL